MRKRLQEIKRKNTYLLKSELSRLCEELKNLGVERIILFGSTARNEIGLYSDIDLIVVLDSQESFLERIETIYKALRPRAAVDMVVYTPDEFAAVKDRNPFLKQALQEGIVIYEKER